MYIFWFLLLLNFLSAGRTDLLTLTHGFSDASLYIASPGRVRPRSTATSVATVRFSSHRSSMRLYPRSQASCMQLHHSSIQRVAWQWRHVAPTIGVLCDVLFGTCHPPDVVQTLRRHRRECVEIPPRHQLGPHLSQQFYKATGRSMKTAGRRSRGSDC